MFKTLRHFFCLNVITAYSAIFSAQDIYAENLQTPNTSLCNTNESIIFNCNIKNSIKSLSVCSSQNLSNKSGYIQYRFGRIGAIELEYPTEKEASRSSFLFATYTRFQVSEISLGFSINNINYLIFDNYYAESKPIVNEKGIAIISQGTEKKHIKLLCGKGAISNLEDLEDIVPCNKNLSFGSCE